MNFSMQFSYRAAGAAATIASAVAGGLPRQQESPSSSPIGPPRAFPSGNSRQRRRAGSVSRAAASPPSESPPATMKNLEDSTLDLDSKTLAANLSTASALVVGRGTAINSTKPLMMMKKKKKNSLFNLAAALFCDAIENAVVNRFYSDAASTSLSGNFAPAESEYGPSFPLRVIGTLPDCLNGEFLRVGPNAKFKPKGNLSFYDGDGMLHGLRIRNGKVTYTSRYVRTSRLSQEESYGAAKFMRAADCSGPQGLFWILLQNLRVKLGVLDISSGYGTANTALVFHNGQLLTLQETDRPYSVRVGDDGELETLGLHCFNGKLDHPFTAHPKVDPETGEMFVLGYNLTGTPHVNYRVVSKGGEMRNPVSINLSGPNPVMMHDFAITEHYAVFLGCPLHFKPKDMVLKNQGVFSFDKSQPTRFGILPRYAGDDSHIQWFELPSCMILHTANAWEEGQEVVLVAFRSPGLTLESINKVVMGKGDAELDSYENNLYEFRFNLQTGAASQKQLGDCVMDFPAINPVHVGRKSRYVYTGLAQDSQGKKGTAIVGVVKFDLTKEPELGRKGMVAKEETNVAGLFWLGEGRYGSEAVFVPRHGNRAGAEEDDGYLIFVVYDEGTGKSEAVVIDARTMAAEPVAVIELPTRVPFGFHGLFVNEQQLAEQDCFHSCSLAARAARVDSWWKLAP